MALVEDRWRPQGHVGLYTNVATADGDLSSGAGLLLPAAFPYCPINEPSSVNLPGIHVGSIF